MQRWVSFVLLLAFIRLQLVCCCGSIGVCCDRIIPCTQETVAESHELAQCDHGHHDDHDSNDSHQNSDENESLADLSDCLDVGSVELPTFAEEDESQHRSHQFYLSGLKQVVTADRVDVELHRKQISYSAPMGVVFDQTTRRVIVCLCACRHHSSVLDSFGYLRI